jgi:hypothetical protein
MRSALGLCCTLAVTTQFGCTNATGELQGGDPLVAATPPVTDAGGTSSMESDAFAATTSDCLPGGAHGDNTWTDLYTCYFGPTAPASCASQSGCHSAADQAGALGSGYVCGTTQQTCWQGMTMSSLSGLAPIAMPFGGTDPTSATLFSALRKADGTGIDNMPLSPLSYIFQGGDMNRISAWIAGGALNN